MRLTFDGEIIYWRGPAPHHFVAVPEASNWAMMILGFGGAGTMIRRRRAFA